nr:SDR family oxidoreductase [Pantoea cypripedii]
MTQATKYALITGGNKGIGFEIAQKLGLQGIAVIIGARNKDRGEEAVKKLAAQGINAQFVQLDLNNPATITTSAAWVQDTLGHLDILVNNAGIMDTRDGAPGDTDLTVIREVFETNFFGTLMVTQAMLPLLKKSPSARIVNVSSQLGSLALNRDPEWEYASAKLIGYNASKAAVNMLTIQLAWELQDSNIKVNSANPGYTATDLVPGAAEHGQPVEDGARTAIQLALLSEDGPTGEFRDNDGVVPW